MTPKILEFWILEWALKYPYQVFQADIAREIMGSSEKRLQKIKESDNFISERVLTGSGFFSKLVRIEALRVTDKKYEGTGLSALLNCHTLINLELDFKDGYLHQIEGYTFNPTPWPDLVNEIQFVSIPYNVDPIFSEHSA